MVAFVVFAEISLLSYGSYKCPNQYVVEKNYGITDTFNKPINKINTKIFYNNIGVDIVLFLIFGIDWLVCIRGQSIQSSIMDEQMDGWMNK